MLGNTSEMPHNLKTNMFMWSDEYDKEEFLTWHMWQTASQYSKARNPSSNIAPGKNFYTGTMKH